MEVDEIQRQVCKFQRVSSNGSTTTTDKNNNSSIPQKLATSRTNFDLQNHDDNNNTSRGGTAIDAGGVARLSGWPSSRIVRVSRASGGKDRHSKVLTSKGLRDRRVRLSVGTAIQFYDLQDRLGFDQPSKAVEWLLKVAASSIDELPSLDLPFPGTIFNEKIVTGNGGNNNMKAMIRAKSPSCSSTSETSKGSGLSLSRSENRIKARERARVNTASKKIESTGGRVMNQVNNNVSETSSFTDLLTGGINTTGVRSPIEYFFNRPMQTSPQLFQIPQFNITNGDNLQQFSFVNDNLNFSMTSPSPSSSSGGGGVSPGGFTRGTLQSNLQSSFLPHPFQRYQSSSIDGSTAANLPFFVPNATGDYFPATGGYYGGGGDGGGRHSDHHKGKSKN